MYGYYLLCLANLNQIWGIFQPIARLNAWPSLDSHHMCTKSQTNHFISYTHYIEFH